MPLTVDEAEIVLKTFIAEEQRRLQTILKPYMDELCHVSFRKPPPPVRMQDGRTMVYIGPTAEDMAGIYKAPRWLEQLCQEDPTMRHMLRQIRRDQSDDIS